MEVKINKEIREYSENMFFGLTLRQFIFSVLGCAAAVGIYFLTKDRVGVEIATWLCVLGVIPFAAVGFIKYNGMPMEKLAAAWLKSKIIYPYRYLSLPRCIYYDAMEENIAIRQGSLSRRQLRKIRKRDKVAKKHAKSTKEKHGRKHR